MAKLEDVINDFYTRLDAGEASANRNLFAGYQRALSAYDAEAAKVLNRIDTEGITDSRAFQYDRLRALAGQATNSMAEFGDLTAEQVASVQDNAGLVARTASVQMIEATGLPLSFASYATLPDSALRRMVGSLQDGSPLRRLANKYAGDSAKEFNRLLIEGVALGRSPLETARLMRNQLGVTYSKARTIVRTEQMRVFREANRQTFKANRGIVKRWKWYSTLDRLTCPICYAMHGQEFGLDERMETHPNCRCIQLPVTATFKELGFTGINEPQATGFAAQSREGQLSEGFRFPAADSLNMKGTTLFDYLPRKDQEAILGRAAFKAYEQGLVKLPDFVNRTYSPDWGWGRKTKPLSSILGREKARSFMGRGPSGSVSATAVAKPVKPITKPVPKTPPKPPPPKAVPAPPKAPANWHPNMTRAEADLWAQQGDLSRPLFHVTSPEGANGITANGFDLSRTKWGRVWGNGAYMSDSAASEAMYSSAFTNPTKIELRVFSRKTLKAQITAAEPYEWGYGNLWNGAARDGIPRGEIEGTYNRKLGEIEARNDKVKADILRANGGVRDNTYYDALNTDKRLVRDPAAQAITETCEEYGYDAIDLFEETHTSSVGGSQVIVFDPKRVTVVKDK